MDQRSIGLLIVVLGVVAVVIGLLVAAGAFGWFGRLPGDIRWEGERTRVFFPITTMIVVSVVLTIVLNLLRR
jgi:hypothetical protein